MVVFENGLQRPVVALFAVLALASLGPGPARADGASLCDPELVVEHPSATSYRERGNRCEGAHSLKVSNDVKLAFASFTDGFELDLASGAPVELTWPPVPGGGDVRLRSRSLGKLRPGLFYRMDAVAPMEPGRFQWGTEVLAALRLGASDVGLMAWTRLDVPGGQDEVVFLPVRAGGSGGPFRLLMVPSERLDEVSFGLTPVIDGELADPVQPRPLGLGYYPENKPTRIELPRPERPGLYRLDVLAGLYRDPSIQLSSSLWLYSPAP